MLVLSRGASAGAAPAEVDTKYAGVYRHRLINAGMIVSSGRAASTWLITPHATGSVAKPPYAVAKFPEEG